MVILPKVSIIVPVYNSEKYLKTCLNSLVRGTLEDVKSIKRDVFFKEELRKIGIKHSLSRIFERMNLLKLKRRL